MKTFHKYFNKDEAGSVQVFYSKWRTTFTVTRRELIQNKHTINNLLKSRAIIALENLQDKIDSVIKELKGETK